MRWIGNRNGCVKWHTNYYVFYGPIYPDIVISIRRREMLYTYWAYSLIGERANLNRCKKHQRKLSVCFACFSLFLSSIDSHFNCTHNDMSSLREHLMCWFRKEENRCNLIWLDWIWQIESESNKRHNETISKMSANVFGCFFVCVLQSAERRRRPKVRIHQVYEFRRPGIHFHLLRWNYIGLFAQNITMQLNIKWYYMCVCVMCVVATNKSEEKMKRNVFVSCVSASV